MWLEPVGVVGFSVHCECPAWGPSTGHWHKRGLFIHPASLQALESSSHLPIQGGICHPSCLKSLFRGTSPWQLHVS